MNSLGPETQTEFQKFFSSLLHTMPDIKTSVSPSRWRDFDSSHSQVFLYQLLKEEATQPSDKGQGNGRVCYFLFNQPETFETYPDCEEQSAVAAFLCLQHTDTHLCSYSGGLERAYNRCVRNKWNWFLNTPNGASVLAGTPYKGHRYVSSNFLISLRSAQPPTW